MSFSLESVQNKWGSAAQPLTGITGLQVKAEIWLELARELRAQGFDLLSSISGVDWPDKLQSVYHLESLSEKIILTIKVDTSRENPEIPSVAQVWPAANWHERECFDLFGIKYLGHPHLKRMFMPEDWVGHPLRKDYETQDEWHGFKEIHPFKGKTPKNYKPGRGLR